MSGFGQSSRVDASFFSCLAYDEPAGLALQMLFCLRNIFSSALRIAARYDVSEFLRITTSPPASESDAIPKDLIVCESYRNVKHGYGVRECKTLAGLKTTEGFLVGTIVLIPAFLGFTLRSAKVVEFLLRGSELIAKHTRALTKRYAGSDVSQWTANFNVWTELPILRPSVVRKEHVALVIPALRGPFPVTTSVNTSLKFRQA